MNPIKPFKGRLPTVENILTGVELLRADATQHDRAEAYEQAMEEAYLRQTSRWKAKENALKRLFSSEILMHMVG